MTTSSAVPGLLLRYSDGTQAMDDDLRTAGRRASAAFQAFLAASPDHVGSRTDLGAGAARHAVRNAETDAWVGRIAMRFLLADGGGLFCSIPPRVVTVDDDWLVRAGFPSRAEAAAAGRAFAEEVADVLDEGEEIDRSVFEAWRDRMETHAADAAFTTAFFRELGAERTVQLVQRVEDNYPREEFGNPEWGLSVVAPFSDALATAMRDRDDPATPAVHRLPESFVDDLLDLPFSYDPRDPQERHLTLLFTNGVFPTDVLLRLGEQVITPRLGHQRGATPIGITAWGWEADPVTHATRALSRNEDASLAYLEAHLRPMLERWAEIDGDGGRSAADMFRQALTHPDRARSGALFDRTVRDVHDIGELRNHFAAPAIAEGAAHHLDRITATAASEGDREALVRTHDVLRLLLADSEAAATLIDASVQYTADTFERADDGDALGSEVWEVGALLGLLLSADTAADVASAEERVARREALLDGIGQISDLALTFTRGRWIPFVTAGRDALLDSFRNTDEVDEALSDLANVRDEYQRGMSELIALRLVHNGVLDPKPAGMSMDAWVNSSEVRDAITDLRTQAGQRFDEVFDLLEPER